MKKVLLIVTATLALSKNILTSALGGYEQADTEDTRVLAAAKFATEKHLMEHSHAGDLGDGPNDLHFEIVEALQQVVEGINFQFTIGLNRNNECEELFRVMLYDKLGEYSMIQWGEPMTCDIKTKVVTEENPLTGYYLTTYMKEHPLARPDTPDSTETDDDAPDS